jgi:F420-dependent oxidoreductase-like protein
MRLGVFIGDASGLRTDVDALLANAREAEDLGFATGWLPHIPWSLDALTAAALAGRVTSRIEIGTAVVPTYPRHPVSMAQQALSAQAACGGRAVLGIGPSHPVVIERMHGLPYTHPARHTAEYVDVLKLAFHGTGHVRHEGEFFQVDAMLEVPGASELPVLVAALAPMMLRAAGTKADGTITYWANERAIAEHVVPTIAAAAATAGRPVPRVVAGIPVAVVSDVDKAKERAATLFAGYNGIPAYQRIRGEGGDSALPDIAIIGDEKTVEARLRGYAEAGATDVAAAVIGLDDDREGSMHRTMQLLADVAPALGAVS